MGREGSAVLFLNLTFEATESSISYGAHILRSIMDCLPPLGDTTKGTKESKPFMRTPSAAGQILYCPPQ